ncbi:MAG TPA: serine/threonine-protein kinase [Kofleriaceae bacterium]|nr:serine/threonine-protein kinase [Kofleriaceae bacterium]
MRFVAPPGMGLEDEHAEAKTIGRYEILETLGKGAMGVVYKARDPLLDRIVAVKTLVAPKSGGKRTRRAYLERFEREAKAAAKMQHPAIVTIFDVGLDNGAPFMVLEYLPGESLADRLDQVRFPLGKGVQVGLDLASALSFAHKERIVHRDVKPANVLAAGEGRWKLADFGIARLPDSDLTQVGIFMGTPGYAPPEAISQGRYTPQADVFAWGAVLYELLSGRIPYEGPDTRTTNGYVLKTTAKSPREHDASIPEPLAEVIMKALHPSIDVRFKDGAEAETALKAAWDECLSSDMVLLQSLTGPELAHDRVGAAMHHTVPTRAQAKGRGGAVPAPVPAATSGRAADRPRPIGDDDPTTIMNRAPESGRSFDSLDEPVPYVRDTVADPPQNTEQRIMATAKAALRRDDDAIAERARHTAKRPADRRVSATPAPALAQPTGNKLGVWIAIVVIAVAAGGAAAYYLISRM